jgi:hypothetical protein
MIRRFTAVLILLQLMMFIGCAHSHKVRKVDTPEFELLVGKTGGFTNINPVFKIKSNGEVLKCDRANAPFYKLKNIDRSKTDSIYSLVMKCNFAALRLKKVSNMTNYLEFTSDKIHNRIEWFDENQLPAGVNELYQYVLIILK